MIKPLRTLRGENANTPKRGVCHNCGARGFILSTNGLCPACDFLQGTPEFSARQLPENPLHPARSSSARNGQPGQDPLPGFGKEPSS